MFDIYVQAVEGGKRINLEMDCETFVREPQSWVPVAISLWCNGPLNPGMLSSTSEASRETPMQTFEQCALSDSVQKVRVHFYSAKGKMQYICKTTVLPIG